MLLGEVGWENGEVTKETFWGNGYDLDLDKVEVTRTHAFVKLISLYTYYLYVSWCPTHNSV